MTGSTLFDFRNIGARNDFALEFKHHALRKWNWQHLVFKKFICLLLGEERSELPKVRMP